MAHIEKIVFVIILMLLGGLMFEGFGAKGYDSSKSPEQLASEASTTLNQVKNDSHWDAMAAAPERKVESAFKELAREARKGLDSGKYLLPLFEPKDKGLYDKRGDPELKAPIKVAGSTIYGAIAVIRPDTTLDPLSEEEDAPPIEAKGSKKKDRLGAMSGYGAEGMGSSMGSESGIGMPGAEGGIGGMTPGPRRLFPRYDRGFGAGASTGYGGMGMGGSMGMDGGMGSYGSSGDMSGAMMPGSGDVSGMMGGMGSVGGLTGLPGAQNRPELKNKKIVAIPQMYNVVMALVPHEEMVKEYEKNFKFAGSYVPYRDRPTYVTFEAQRVDVTDNPLRKFEEIDEKEWVSLSDSAFQLSNVMREWVNKPDPRLPPLVQIPDPIDPLAKDPTITMVVPPFYIQSNRQACKHPDIEWAWDANTRRMLEMRPEFKPLEEDDTLRPGQRPAGMAGGMAGMGGMYGSGDPSGMGMYGSSGGDMYGAMGMDGGMGMAGMAMDGGMGSYGSGGDMYGGMGSYGSGGDMYGGMGYGGGMGMMPGALVPKYKMVRFYDRLSPEQIGKVYRYRVRLMMDDPNYAENPNALDASQLKTAVFRRVAELRRNDDKVKKKDEELLAKQKFPKNTPQMRKDYRTLRRTPWSEPSDLFRVEQPIDIVLGEVKPQRIMPFNNGALQVPQGEPSSKLIVAELDQTGAMFPMVLDRGIVRGAVLNATKKEKEIEVVHPQTKIVKLVKNPKPIQTGATVVDIRGMEALANSASDDPLTDAGEVMIITGAGTVRVLNEWDDALNYRMYTFADEKEAAEKATQPGMMGGGMEGEVGSGMPGSY